MAAEKFGRARLWGGWANERASFCPLAVLKPLAIRPANRAGHSPERRRSRAFRHRQNSRQKGNDGHQGTSAEVNDTTGPEEGVRRRDFINIAAVSFAGVGAVATLAPLIVQMAPSTDVLAMATTEVDISTIEPGQAIKARCRKQPVFVRNLTPKEIAEAERGAAVATCAIRRRSPSGPSRARRTG